MDKIPVGQTIGGAYRFAFARFPAVLGVVWLPITLTAAAGYFLFHDLRVLPIVPENYPGAQIPPVRELLNFWLSVQGPFRWFELVLWAAATMLEVGLARAALGIGGTPFVFFNLGAPFWRMLGANLIFYVILLIVMVPMFAVLGFVMAIGAASASAVDPAALHQLGPWLAVPFALLIIATIAGVYYVYARLWFFIAPVVVAEEHIDLRRGWRLAKGNVWRIIGVVLGVSLPLILVIAAAEGVALWTVFSGMRFGQFPDARVFSENSPMFAAVLAIIAICWILLMALIQGARVSAYRALVPAEGTDTDA